MLHLEIRKIDSNVPNAYRVSHNPGVPDEYSVLLDGSDPSWENFDSGETPYLYSLIKNDNDKWVIRVGLPNDSGGNAGKREVGILFSQNDNILGIVIALFNAAPGQGYLSEFSTAVSNGLTESQLAEDVLAASSVFTDNILGDKDKDAMIKELMSHFGLDANDDKNIAASAAKAYFNQRIDSNVGYGAIATEATYYLLSNPLLNNEVDKEFLPTSLLFKLKVVVADKYSASNSSTDLATLQAVLAGITLREGTSNSDTINGSPFGGVIVAGLGGDVIILEIDQNARDILLLNSVHDSQILNINNDSFISIRKDVNNNLFLDTAGKLLTSAADTADGIDASKFILRDAGNNLFFDVVTNFSGGAADTDDRIDVSSFNFTETQSVLLDVSARVSIDDNIVQVPDLFFDDRIAGNRGLAFLKYPSDEASSNTITYIFIDGNKDGDFTVADDSFLVLVGVDDVINANFIYFPGDIGSVSEPPIDPLTLTLTVATDIMIGSSNNDLFSAPVVNADGAFNTLQSADILDGSEGMDTVTATLSNENITPELTNIENIDARFEDTGVLDLSNAFGVTQIIVQRSTAVGTVSNFSSEGVLGVKNQNQGVEFIGSESEVQVRSLMFDNVGASQDIEDQVQVDLEELALTANITTNDANVKVFTLEGVEFLNIAAEGENRINLATTQDTVTNITVSGTGSVDLTDASFSAVQRIDGVVNLGGISVDASASTSTTDFLGSPADDHYTSSPNGDIITAGGGQDTITLTAFFAFDTLIFAAGDSVLNADMDSHDIVNNFGSANGDIIDLSAFGFTGEQALALADKGTLTNSAVDGSTLFVPDFYSSAGVDRGVAIGINGNDSYVFVDASKDGDFNAASDLFIKLTGTIGNLSLADFAF